jgi:hypothetical protein
MSVDVERKYESGSHAKARILHQPYFSEPFTAASLILILAFVINLTSSFWR